jgi:hypothetical protein
LKDEQSEWDRWLSDLEQVGIAVGTVCTAINDQPAYDFLAQGALPHDEALWWDFNVGGRSIRLVLVFKTAVTPSVAPIEQATTNEGAEAPASDASEPREDDAVPHNSEFTESQSADEQPWHGDSRPLFENLPEWPVEYRNLGRVRPPRPTAVNWPGWGREKDDPKECGND